MAQANGVMRAIQYDGYGGGAAALKHVVVQIPCPKEGEILLKVEATSINPIDWKLQKGMMRPFLPPKFPFIPGVDVAGEIIEVGDERTNFKQGDKVIAMLNLPKSGGLAEYAVAPVTLTVPRPSELAPAEASGLPTAAVIALQALKTAGVEFDGRNISSNTLITAASGGVGHYAVQLAKFAGLHVTATCGSRNMELVKSLGADEVLDYKKPAGADLRSPSGKKYDTVIHCATGISWGTFEANLSAEGKVIDISPSFRSMFTSLCRRVMMSKKKLVTLLLEPKVEDIKFVVELAKEGRLRTFVDSKYGLEKAEEAWAKSMSGRATGKVVVEM
ncbi:chloroplast envelope quinone oxidoreductase homolog [Zingiber officinale]|uniref:chloroplast envelope quinone oxidoreductase homolog n=1 Tax=Zingiber officinale TaxID=94328 RepID=UPI001C4BF0FE|nr:chloroplast envelope quinone oxidoreductase homolog [Zingiber officinale]